MNKMMVIRTIAIKGFKSRDEAEDDYSRFVLKVKSNHEVHKGVGQMGLSRLKNLIIFTKLIIIVVLLLSHVRLICRVEW